MKTVEVTSTSAVAKTQEIAPRLLLPSAKIASEHLEKLAIVYVRQSSPKQVLENRESTARQYAFAEQAVALGWPREHIFLSLMKILAKAGARPKAATAFSG